MSSARITWLGLLLFLCGGIGTARALKQTAPAEVSGARGARNAESAQADPAKLFQRGEDALNQGKLEEAERDFRAVLAVDPQAGGAYANLGVVYMRRKQWTLALRELRKAERLMPQVAGIRLNIGLAYYRQNEFLKAIPPFESVVREKPNALQPRYLLGLCYFFAERWADAASTLEPLWAQESGQFAYLYVLSNAAHRAGRKELDEQAAAKLVKVGDGSAEYHLFVGKYHLNLGHYDEALKEFEAGAEGNPRLPFVHFNLGLVHLKKQEYESARDEFLKDAEIEPDLALDYQQLGDVYWLMQQDDQAEKSYREALRREPNLVDSRIGLAKIYQRQKKYAQALAEIDAGEKEDPARPDVHYLRGRVLLQMGHKEEARKEQEEAERIQERGTERQRKENESSIPSPELLEQSQ